MATQSPMFTPQYDTEHTFLKKCFLFSLLFCFTSAKLKWANWNVRCKAACNKSSCRWCCFHTFVVGNTSYGHQGALRWAWIISGEILTDLAPRNESQSHHIPFLCNRDSRLHFSSVYSARVSNCVGLVLERFLQPALRSPAAASGTIPLIPSPLLSSELCLWSHTPQFKIISQQYCSLVSRALSILRGERGCQALEK